MNILIVSHFYEIDGVMGSVRWTSFAHRLAKENNILLWDFNKLEELIEKANSASKD